MIAAAPSTDIHNNATATVLRPRPKLIPVRFERAINTPANDNDRHSKTPAMIVRVGLEVTAVTAEGFSAVQTAVMLLIDSLTERASDRRSPPFGPASEDFWFLLRHRCRFRNVRNRGC
jgi:hypothetical protein